MPGFASIANVAGFSFIPSRLFIIGCRIPLTIPPEEAIEEPFVSNLILYSPVLFE